MGATVVYWQGQAAAVPKLKETGHAFFEHDYPVFDASCACLLLEQLQRFIHRFVRKPEGSIVHGDHPARVQVKKCSGGVGGIGMHIAKGRRVVSADREQSQFWRKPLPDLAAARKVSRVSRV